jgi:hypothetical protein
MDPTDPGPDSGLNSSSPFLPCLGSVRISLVDILILIMILIFVLILEYCEQVRVPQEGVGSRVG